MKMPYCFTWGHFIDTIKVLMVKVTKKQRIIILVLVAAASVVAIGILWVLFAYDRPSEQQAPVAPKEASSNLDYKEAAKNINSEDAGSLSTIDFVGDYEAYYDEAAPKLRKSDPTTWNQEMIDTAYLCLLYAYRTEMNLAAEDVTVQIDGARAAGVNVDKNSANISEQRFNEIKSDIERKINEEIEARAQ